MAREKIVTLSEQQQARDKLSIWFGSRDNFYHPLIESIANGIDEINNHFDKGLIEISIDNSLYPGKSVITVKDSGRGIPIGEMTGDVHNYTLLFEKLFAGTKYDNTSSQANTGTNGVGNTVINYTSEYFECQSLYNGILHKIVYKNGGENPKYSEDKQSGDSFSLFRFTLDDTVYSSNKYSEKEVENIIRHFSVVSNKIHFLFEFIDEDSTQNVQKTFHYDSILDYFEELIHGQNTSGIISIDKPIIVKNDEETNEYNLLITTTPETHQESYLNGTYLQNGGSINSGVIDGARQFINRYCKENKIFNKQIKSLDRDDIENSLSFIVSVNSTNVEYENQTKISTQKKLYRSQIKDIVSEQLNIQATANKSQFQKLINHVLEVHKNNKVNDRAQKRLKKKLSENINSLNNRVDSLIDCDKHNEKSELFIVEGLSALGSISAARDSNYQAAYPLTGKILNVLKASNSEIMNNSVITDLVKTIGTGMNLKLGNKNNMKFDISKSRFGKIICSSDADADGFQINSLVITLINKLMPGFITEGRVYVSQTPLYIISYSDDTKEYLHSEDERNHWKPKKSNIKYTIERAKGLGQLDARVMSDTGMNVKTRNIIQITKEDADKFEEYLNLWMGISSDCRKSEIDKNLYKYVNEID